MQPVQQLPFRHRPPVQAVRLATLPFSTHTGPPVEQSMAPVLHTSGGEQAAPWLHATQLPLPLQTPPGQPTPAPTLPVS